jgi:hypothetical protein
MTNNGLIVCLAMSGRIQGMSFRMRTKHGIKLPRIEWAALLFAYWRKGVTGRQFMLFHSRIDRRNLVHLYNLKDAGYFAYRSPKFVLTDNGKEIAELWLKEADSYCSMMLKVLRGYANRDLDNV